MKKSTKDFRTDDLMIDVIEYAFTEWLVRKGIFTCFKTNYECIVSPYKGFRGRLRAHIRRSLCLPGFDPSRLISSAFLFISTPEGDAFWQKQSAAWERFCIKFQTKL